jgi:hypothetical protein
VLWELEVGDELTDIHALHSLIPLLQNPFYPLGKVLVFTLLILQGADGQYWF